MSDLSFPPCDPEPAPSLAEIIEARQREMSARSALIAAIRGQKLLANIAGVLVDMAGAAATAGGMPIGATAAQIAHAAIDVAMGASG